MMLFSKKRALLHITKEKIRWALGAVPDGKILGVKELPWSGENLVTVLKDIEKNFPRKVRVVVGEELSYVTSFQKKDKKIPILNVARALIPENLQDGWDSREIAGDEIELMAVRQDFFQMLERAFAQTKLKVEALEAESVAICRLIEMKKDQAALFVKRQQEVLLGVAQNGVVVATKIFPVWPDKDQVAEFLQYVAEQKKAVAKIAYVEVGEKESAVALRALKMEVREIALDPLAGISRKKDISGRDKDVLNIFLEKKVSTEAKVAKNVFQKTESADKKSASRKKEKILVVIFLVVIIGGAISVYLMQKSRQEKAATKRQSPSVENEASGLEWGK